MKLGDWMLSQNAHFRITIGMAILLGGILAALVTWKADTTNNIERNKSSIERVADDVEHNSGELRAISPAIIEIQTDLKWIRADLEKR